MKGSAERRRAPSPTGRRFLAMSRQPAIEVVNARTHNLKGVCCRVPHRRVTVVTGISGAGKSSLAFDTVYAEGQRRFVESMSTYARQFLDQMERPPVDDVRNVLPPVALEARNSIRNARSTVATISEVSDVLRLLFAHLGEIRCPVDGEPARSWTAAEIAAELASGALGESFLLAAPVARPARRADRALSELVRQGFRRRLDGEEIVELGSEDRWNEGLDPLPVVLGRFRSGQGGARLLGAVEDGLRLGAGRVEAVTAAGRRLFATALGCALCGRSFRPPQPALFSFNSPLGACPECQGFGRVIGVDRERVVPDPTLALAERPIAPWNTPAYSDLYDELFAACEARGVPLDRPWGELPAAVREWIWSGDGDFTSLAEFFAWLEQRSYKVHVRVLLARYRSYDPCPACGGARLQPEALLVRLGGCTFPELLAMSVAEVAFWLGSRRWSQRQRQMAGHLLQALAERIGVLERVGLDYLRLDRQARTLSGGEAQRIHLAAALGSGLTETLYVLDEPTVGLHPQDSGRLLALLKSLADRGNTVLVVEHDRRLIEGADHIVDLGPGAGAGGGEVLVEGGLDEVLAAERSLTAEYLRQRPRRPARKHLERYRRERGQESTAEELAARPRFRVVGAREHNLRDLTVEFPQRALVAVTGVSGSGKSTLVENVIHDNLRRRQGSSGGDPGPCDALEGFEAIDEVVLVDQQPLGRSSRSNPVTYLKAYDEIRRLYAGVPEARRRGIKARHFSFNLDQGRCPVCRGTGQTEVDMQFMAAVSVTCDACQGHRFKPEILAIRHRGLNIAETLELTVAEAVERFAERPRLLDRLSHLVDAGLGYLRLGQPTSTLSGGEAQRLKLASFLAEGLGRKRRLFLFDEPTTGLHMADIDLLYRTLRRLVAADHSVVVVEHSLDLVARADWIVDLGPGGGDQGGELLYCGPLGAFLESGAGPTADELRDHLGLRSGAARRALG